MELLSAAIHSSTSISRLCVQFILDIFYWSYCDPHRAISFFPSFKSVSIIVRVFIVNLFIARRYSPQIGLDPISLHPIFSTLILLGNLLQVVSSLTLLYSYIGIRLISTQQDFCFWVRNFLLTLLCESVIRVLNYFSSNGLLASISNTTRYISCRQSHYWHLFLSEWIGYLAIDTDSQET